MERKKITMTKLLIILFIINLAITGSVIIGLEISLDKLFTSYLEATELLRK